MAYRYERDINLLIHLLSGKQVSLFSKILNSMENKEGKNVKIGKLFFDCKWINWVTAEFTSDIKL